MTAAEAIALLGRVRAHLREAPAYADKERLALLSELSTLQGALSVPTSLCTRDQIVDAVVSDDPEPGEAPLLDEILDQYEEGALLFYLADRQVRDRKAAALGTPAPPDPSEGP